MQELEKALKNSSLMLCVHVGVSHRLAIIDKYYSKTNESTMWKTAMSKFVLLLFSSRFLTVSSSVLHPRYKLNYFRNQNWLPEWIKTAKQSAQDTWKLYYKPTITETVSTTVSNCFRPY